MREKLERYRNKSERNEIEIGKKSERNEREIREENFQILEAFRMKSEVYSSPQFDMFVLKQLKIN